MEVLAGAPDGLLSGAERAEVLGRAGDDIGEELHHDPIVMSK